MPSLKETGKMEGSCHVSFQISKSGTSTTLRDVMDVIAYNLFKTGETKYTCTLHFVSDRLVKQIIHARA